MLLALSSTTALTTQSSKSASRSFQPEFQRFASSVSLTLQRPPSPSTKLLYAGENVEDDKFQIQNYRQPAQKIRSKLSSLWSLVSPFKQKDKNEEQQNVDEYLEFLDKRYHRLHDVNFSLSKPKPFSAWDWLMDNNESHDLQRVDDALFVLGVSQLASERLRKDNQAATPVIDIRPIIPSKATTGLFGVTMRKKNHIKAEVRSALLKLKAKNDSLASLIAAGDKEFN